MGDKRAGGPPADGEHKPFIDQVFEDQGRRPTPDEAVALGLPIAEDEPDDEQDDETTSEPQPEQQPEPEPDPEPVLAPEPELDASELALVEEAMKKSGLIWIPTPRQPEGRAFWHAWVDGRGYLLTGPGEQPDPGWSDGSPLPVLVRSKDNQHRLVTWDAVVTRVAPADPDWEEATTALAAGRLNLRASDTAAERWATGDAAIYRLEPAGTLGEQPGRYSDVSHRAAPVPTSATTVERKPWVLGPRGRAGRPLS